jgi:hypothetical protein
MIDAGKSLHAGLNPLVEFLRRHLYPIMPSGQENLCPFDDAQEQRLQRSH